MGIWKTKWGWRADFLFRGERIIHKGFFKYKDEARQWIKDEREELKNQKRYSSQDRARDLSFWTLAQKYLADCKVNFDKKTFGEKKYCLERFYKEIGDVDITSIEPHTILDFINARAKSQSNNAANKDRKNLKAFYSWAQEMYGVMYDPTGPIKKKSHTKKPRRLIPVQDILKVMLVAKGQDRVLIGSYWHTGARKGEILRWTWAEDINFEERWVRLGTRKSRTGEMVYEKLWMNDDLYNLLMWQWKNRHKRKPYVFPKHYCLDKTGNNWRGEQRANRLLKKLCQKAGVEAFGYHDIRHTVAKYLNDLQKVNLKKVQQVLRHRRQTTTEIYVEGNYTGTKEVMGLLELGNLENFK